MMKESDGKFLCLAKEEICRLIEEKFPNGIRLNSNIDFDKAKAYYKEMYGKELQDTINTFNYKLKEYAVVYEDRAYICDFKLIDFIRTEIENAESKCICIRIFFEKNRLSFNNLGVFSHEMLHAVLNKYCNEITIKYGYILKDKNYTPSDSIREAFNERESWSLHELEQYLKIIKYQTIQQTINQSQDYLCIGKGVYTHVDNIYLRESEVIRVVEEVEDEIKQNGFLLANQLDMNAFLDENPNYPLSVIKDALYAKYLSDNYEKRGFVITEKGKPLHVYEILDNYCRGLESVSFDDLVEFEKTLNVEGRCHSQCLIAAHKCMIRVHANLFVSDSKINFNIEETDQALLTYCYGDFLPLKELKDLSLLPYIGYQWNLYLVESYVRRFSRLFTYESKAVNSANVGAIIRKESIYQNYDDVMAKALAESYVDINNKHTAIEFLFEKGYIGRRNLGTSEDYVFSRAKNFR